MGMLYLYRQKPVATKKPGVGDYYVKDVYKDISNYHKRQIKYFEDKDRFSSVYAKDIIQPINQQDYLNPQQKFNLDAYQYSHDENLRKLVTDRNKNEEEIRNKL